MVKEAYCSYEVAKLLKEKGFSENTICKYADVGGITEKWYDDYRERVLRFNWNEGYLIEPLIEPKGQYEIIGDTIPAPTLQMAMKWLREVHGLFITIYPNYGTEKIAWSVNQRDYDMNWVTIKHNYADYYEEACEAAIRYTLENLI